MKGAPNWEKAEFGGNKERSGLMHEKKKIFRSVKGDHISNEGESLAFESGPEKSNAEKKEKGDEENLRFCRERVRRREE